MKNIHLFFAVKVQALTCNLYFFNINLESIQTKGRFIRIPQKQKQKPGEYFHIYICREREQKNRKLYICLEFIRRCSREIIKQSEQKITESSRPTKKNRQENNDCLIDEKE